MAVPTLSLFAGLLIVVFATYKYIVHPVFISSLSKVPNAHFTSSISPAWILWKRYTDTNNVTTYNAHRKHGPIVRLAPNEISINCVDEGIRTVYAGGMEKTRWYPDQFMSYGVPNIFTTVGHHGHSARKRMLSNVYSKSFLQASSQIEANSRSLLRDRFLPVIEQAARTGTALDVHGMNNGFTMDFMSAYLFGSANATNFTQDAVAKHGFLELYHNRRVYEFFSQEANGLKELTRKIGLPVPVPKWVDEANQRIEAWILKMCDKADLCLDTLPSPGFEPVVYKQLKNSMEKVQGEIWGAEKRDSMRLEMASEMLDELGAGHETSAVALTYLYWEMSQRPDLQRKLRAELITLEPPINWPPGVEGMCQLPAPKSIDGLPLLHAIIMETLRLHSPIPGIQPRITPPGGCTLAGYSNIPANVRVSATAYCLHRNENVFPQPEQWKPERWLKPADSAEMKEMLRWFWAFGSGGRMCLGSNLAMQEIKLLVAAIYNNYTTSIVNDEGIEAIDAYATRPRSNQLILKFKHI